MRAMPLFLLLLLAGCGLTTPSQRRAQDTAFIGGSEAALVAALGPPASITPGPDGSHTLSWGHHRSEWVQASPFNSNPPELLGLDYNGLPPRLLTWSCDRRFLVQGGRVVSYAQSGNDC